MKHSSSREFFAYWNAKRGTARAPDRSEFEPSAVRELLSDIFVLSYDGETRFPFRVAGTRISALLGCDLKNRSFSALFTDESRGEIEEIITCVVEETLPAIAGISAFTLAARFPGKRSLFYLALAMGCLALCVLTTARAGLLGMILGLILVAIFTRKLKLLAAPVALVFVALLVTAVADTAEAAGAGRVTARMMRR